MRAILHGNKLILKAEDDYIERIFLQDLSLIPETIIEHFGKNRITFTYCKDTRTLEIRKEKEEKEK